MRPRRQLSDLFISGIIHRKGCTHAETWYTLKSSLHTPLLDSLLYLARISLDFKRWPFHTKPKEILQ